MTPFVTETLTVTDGIQVKGIFLVNSYIKTSLEHQPGTKVKKLQYSTMYSME